MTIERSSPAPADAQAARSESLTFTLWPVLAAATLGITLLYVVGFAAPHSVHEAAHDTRHSMNFPCH